MSDFSNNTKIITYFKLTEDEIKSIVAGKGLVDENSKTDWQKLLQSMMYITSDLTSILQSFEADKKKHEMDSNALVQEIDKLIAIQ